MKLPDSNDCWQYWRMLKGVGEQSAREFRLFRITHNVTVDVSPIQSEKCTLKPLGRLTSLANVVKRIEKTSFCLGIVAQCAVCLSVCLSPTYK